MWGHVMSQPDICLELSLCEVNTSSVVQREVG
jgi:hypothetical protein